MSLALGLTAAIVLVASIFYTFEYTTRFCKLGQIAIIAWWFAVLLTWNVAFFKLM